MPARIRALPVLLVATALLASCGRDPAPVNQTNITAEQADEALDDAINGVEDADVGEAGALVPPAPGEVGGLPDDREPLNEGAARNPTSVEASGTTIELWGIALGEGRYGEAYRLWRDNGRQSGMSEAQFADAYRKYREIHVLVGRPQAGGTQTARVPVQVYGRLRADGEPFNLIGMMTLARNPDGQQGEAGQRPWLIAAADLQARGTVKIARPDDAAARIPAAFQGNWSRTAANCGKPGDDMRLAVGADSLVFYESEGMVTAVKPVSANRIEVKADYNGEGDKWSETTSLILSDSGKALTIGKVKRVRCAA